MTGFDETVPPLDDPDADENAAAEDLADDNVAAEDPAADQQPPPPAHPDEGHPLPEDFRTDSVQ